jgi:hypothetical protein
MMPTLIKYWIGQFLGAVPDDFVAVFEEVIIGFIDLIG